MIRCPHCQIAAIPGWVKFWPATGGAFECPECNRGVSISPSVYVVTIAVLVGILVVSWFAETAGMKWSLIGGALLIAILFAWLAPLRRR
jgi:hypothetical protein